MVEQPNQINEPDVVALDEFQLYWAAILLQNWFIHLDWSITEENYDWSIINQWLSEQNCLESFSLQCSILLKLVFVIQRLRDQLERSSTELLPFFESCEKEVSDEHGFYKYENEFYEYDERIVKWADREYLVIILFISKWYCHLRIGGTMQKVWLLL